MANIHIQDSYKVSKRQFDFTLDCFYWNDVVKQRSRFSLKMEWATHNGLYALGLWKDHTKDVDLNYPQDKWKTICYVICGLAMWPFIK